MASNHIKLPDFVHRIGKGIVLVINNINFKDNQFNERVGSKNDEDAIEICFHKLLNWDFELLQNLTADKMKKLIIKYSEKDFSYFDALLVVVMSHGDSNGVYGVDNNLMEIESLLRHFSATNCPSLANKPKIFIFQACRGSRNDAGFCEVDGPTKSPRIIRIPNFSDFLIAYPCIPGHISLRDTRSGTIYIQTLIFTLMQYYKKEHILDIFLRTSYLVAKSKVIESSRCMPCLDIRLRKKCFFGAFFIGKTEEQINALS